VYHGDEMDRTVYRTGTVLKLPDGDSYGDKYIDSVSEKSPKEQYGEYVVVYGEPEYTSGVMVLTENLGGGCAYLPPYLLVRCTIVGWVFDLMKDLLE